MILTDKLVNHILINPAIEGADKLYIIAGYATPQMASWHIQRLNDLHISPIKISLIVGMTANNGIEQMLHDGFIDVAKRYKNIEGYSSFQCQYIFNGPPVNSKLYLWEKSGKLMNVFIGSADYSQSCFNPHHQKECMAKIEGNKDVIKYFDAIEKNSIFVLIIKLRIISRYIQEKKA